MKQNASIAKNWLLLPLAVSLGGGLYLGWIAQGGSSGPTKTTENPPPSASSANISTASAPPPQDTKPLLERLHQAMATGSLLDKALAINKLLENLGQEKLEELLRDSGPMSEENRWILHKVLARKLALYAPEKALDLLWNLLEKSTFPHPVGIEPISKDIETIFSRWVSDAPGDATRWLTRQREGQLRTYLSHTLLRNLASTDPAAAIGLMQTTFPNTPDGERSLLRALVEGWAKHDHQAALAWAGQLTDPDSRLMATAQAGEVWAHKDPQAALAWAKTLAHAELKSHIIERAFWFWTQTDAPASFSFAQKLEPQESRADALRMVMRVWLNKNPEEALQAVSLIADGGVRTMMLTNFIRTINADYAVRLSCLELLPLGNERSHLLNSFISSVSGFENMALVDRVYGLFSIEDKNSMTKSLVEKIAIKDTAAALAWAEALPPGSVRSEAIAKVVAIQGSREPKSALEIAIKHKLLDSSELQYTNPLPLWLNNNPDEVIAWVKSLPAGPEKDKLLSLTVRELGRSDFPTALALFQNEMSVEERRRNLGDISQSWALNDPKGALAWAENLKEEDEKAVAVKSVATSWSGTDPIAAITFLQQLPDKNLAKEASGEVLGNWSHRDSRSMKVWMDTLPEGELRDTAIRTYSYRIKDETAAFDLLATMTNPENRWVMMKVRAWDWLHQDPAAAKAWLERTPHFTSEQKQEILSKKR